MRCSSAASSRAPPDSLAAAASDSRISRSIRAMFSASYCPVTARSNSSLPTSPTSCQMRVELRTPSLERCTASALARALSTVVNTAVAIAASATSSTAP